MAAIHGLSGLMSFKLACVLGLITWLPYAALYANTMQITASKIYLSSNDMMNQIKKIQFSPFIIALCSGASFAEIAIVFFDPHMNLPAIFKLEITQFFASFYLIPFAFVSASIVNYFAFHHLLGMMENKKIKSI